MKIKIILADDHPMVRLGVATMLSNQPDFEILAQYEKTSQLMQGLYQLQPDVLLLDLQLSDGNSELIISDVKDQYPNIKILVLSSNDNIHNIKLILNKGADGYILKNTEQDFLVHAIRIAYGTKGNHKIVSDDIAQSLHK
jgi:DNA-binding NarL/FixJ family response regulator